MKCKSFSFFLVLVGLPFLGIVSCQKKSVPAAARALFPVEVHRRWGFIDTNGQIVIQPQYESAHHFSEGLAAVSVNGKWGYIDSAGQMIIKPKFFFTRPFSDGLACVMENPQSYQYIDREGKTLVTLNGASPRNIVWKQNLDDKTVVDRIIEPERIWTEDFSEGLAPIASKDLWGFMDKTAKVVIEPRFQRVRPFSEGRAAVQPELRGMWGYIDTTGQMVIEARYESASEFSDGLAAVCCDSRSKSIFINPSGEQALPYAYQWPGPFKDGRAYVEFGVGDLKGAYIDKRGTFLFKTPSTISKGRTLPEGLAPVEIASHIPSEKVRGMELRIRWGYMDHTGQMAIEPQFQNAEPFHNGLASVVLDGKAAYINKSGGVVWKSEE